MRIFRGDMHAASRSRGLRPGEPGDLSGRAADNLRYIREAMERAGSFTAVPGWGTVAMGVVALVAAVIAALRTSPESWLGVWLAAAILAVAIGGTAMARKARAAEVPLLSGPGRRFGLSLAPALVAGALLTGALLQVAPSLLPGLWLLLYGVGLVTAGLFSIRAVPMMGFGFMALGVSALFVSAVPADAWLAAGFGGLHVGFGLWIARRHGG